LPGRAGVQQVDRGLSEHQALPGRSLERHPARSAASGQPRTVARYEEATARQGRRRLVTTSGSGRGGCAQPHAPLAATLQTDVDIDQKLHAPTTITIFCTENTSGCAIWPPRSSWTIMAILY